MTVKLGLDCNLYYNSGTYDIPVWEEVCNVRDVTISHSQSEADISTRCTDGFRANVGTLTDTEYSWQMVYDDQDATYTYFLNAFLNRTDVDLAIAFGDITTTGTSYWRVITKIIGFDENQALEEAVSADVTARYTLNNANSGANVAPARVTVP